jgi:hypothetical protein
VELQLMSQATGHDGRWFLVAQRHEDGAEPKQRGIIGVQN